MAASTTTLSQITFINPVATSVKLYSSSVDTPLKLLEFFYSQESGSIRSPINAEAFPLVEEVT